MASNKKSAGDERFRRVQKDPRFWEMPDRDRKVKIDRRFQSMFHDRRFKTTYTVDKRGRPVNHSTADDLKRFYQVSDSEEEDEEDDKKKKSVKQSKAAVHDGKGGAEDDDDDDDDEDDDSEEEEEDEEMEEQESDSGGSSEEEDSESESDDSEPDLARGIGNIETSSDEDEEDDVDNILRREEEEIEHDWGELCKDAPRSDEVSVRLAVCNMDWDRMKAKDLLVLFNSFCPKGGAVLSVKIYPSQFGKERLKAEETQGPPELKAIPDDSEEDNEEERVYREKMRDYQFKRLKYFYAVLECDSIATASRIYEECDGYEYESSCSVLDLRFIPDDVTFDEEPKDVASDVNVSAYEPKLFTSSANATSKVQLTWDETDHERVSALNRKFNKDELLDMDFKAYLASSSEEEEEEEEEEQEEEAEEINSAEGQGEQKAEKKKKKKSEEQISKYRELLKDIQSKEKKEDRDMEMEISWVPGLKETTERLVKKKLEVKEQQTPWEEYLQKKKDKKKKKKSEKKQAEQDDDMSDDELPDDVDLSDPFFSEELRGAGRKTKQKPQQKKEEHTSEDEEQLQKQKAEMALLMDDDEDDKHKHFNYDKIVEEQNLSKKKKKKLLKKRGEQEEQQEEDQFQVDVSDSRFQALFTSHLYNLDPSHPSFKKTKSTQSIVAEKQRRRAQQATPTQIEAVPTPHEAKVQQKTEPEAEAPPAKKATMDPSVSMLIKSIKSKTQQFHSRKKFTKKL